MTKLQARLREILRNGPLFPDEIYAKLWPGRKPAHPGPSRGGPDSQSVAVHRMLGRSSFRDLFERDTSHLKPGGPGVCRYRNRRVIK